MSLAHLKLGLFDTDWWKSLRDGEKPYSESPKYLKLMADLENGPARIEVEGHMYELSKTDLGLGLRIIE